MFQKAWEVLIVDDEPDILTVSKLAARGIKVFGIPLHLHLCQSKAEAMALLSKKSEILPSLAVAIIDVVMETEHAGLELCQYIREERNNPLVQLYIRTGQPGVAPERTVIDRFEINGYFTKVEATEDKLYSMIKSGIRQFYWASYALGGCAVTGVVARATGSRLTVESLINQLVHAVLQDRDGEPTATFMRPNLSVVMDDRVVANVGWDSNVALQERDRLNQLAGVPIGTNGDKYVIDEQNRFLIKVAAQPNLPETFLISTPTFRVPEFVPILMHNSLVCWASSWHHSKDNPTI